MAAFCAFYTCNHRYFRTYANALQQAFFGKNMALRQNRAFRNVFCMDFFIWHCSNPQKKTSRQPLGGLFDGMWIWNFYRNIAVLSAY